MNIRPSRVGIAVWSALLWMVLASSVRAEGPSFANDVMPVLTRFGCNSGGCHGKLAGQNGFKLSLRGYAPDADFESLARESQGRRINAVAPGESLLIRKAGATRDRLVFVTEALRRLLADESFVNLLRAEGLDTLPRNLAARMQGRGAQAS